MGKGVETGCHVNGLERSFTIERIQSTASTRLQEQLSEARDLREGIEKEYEREHRVTERYGGAGTGKEKRKIIGFADGDPDNPHNWSLGKRYFISFVCILLVVNSTFASSLPSGAITAIQEDFGIANSTIPTLTISFFLIGYVVGPILCAPLSEVYGRRWVTICCFVWFFIWTIACAVAPNMPALIVFRFLTGLGASAPLSVTGGNIADIWPNPIARGRCMAIFCAVTMIGPTAGPITSGFLSLSSVGWRMAFWVCAILTFISFVPVWFTPETFRPVILLNRAKRLRREGHDVLAPAELEDRSLINMIKVTMTRPFRMFFKESIVFLASMFLALIYGTFYLLFLAFPIIYQGIYHFRTGISDLPFIPVAIGGAIACIAVVLWDQHLIRVENSGRKISPEYRRLPLACIGGPMLCVGLFWLGWTSRPSVHWISAVLAGAPFGFGFCMIFISCLNYITDAYEIYAASALAAASMCRSIFGAIFPLFAKQMYYKLTVPWATSLLGFATVGMSIIPFLFIKYGTTIRARSAFCQYLLERKRILEEGSTRASEDTANKGAHNQHGKETRI